MQPQETKPGLKTTEFWVQFVLQIIFLLNTTNAWNYMPAKYTASAQAILGGAYVISRGIAKVNVPYEQPPQPRG
jgi:hypothetical protein